MPILNVILFYITVGIASDLDVRLVGSPMNGMGAVEVYTSLRWVSVCPDSGCGPTAQPMLPVCSWDTSLDKL